MKYLIILAILITGCSTYKAPTVKRPKKVYTIYAPTDKVWKGIIKFFGKHNVPIQNMDKASLFIKTEKVNLKTTFGGVTLNGKKTPIKNEWCDCGKGGLVNVWSSKTRINLSYNIVLEKMEGDNTQLTINIFYNGTITGKRNAYASGNDVGIDLSCISTGKMEKLILDYINTHIKK